MKKQYQEVGFYMPEEIKTRITSTDQRKGQEHHGGIRKSKGRAQWVSLSYLVQSS